MNITLYQNSSESNRLTKDLSNPIHLEGTLRTTTSVKNPVITIESSSDIISRNYAYIEEFDRYYYISDIKSIRNGLWEVTFNCDVLMSFRSDILNSYGLIDNSQDVNISNYLASDVWTNLVKDKTDIINFDGSSLLESGEYILITAGG